LGTPRSENQLWFLRNWGSTFGPIWIPQIFYGM
jgi:hypothetical protein